MHQTPFAPGLRAGDPVPCGACKCLTPFRGGHYAPSSELCLSCTLPPPTEQDAMRYRPDWE